MNDMSRGLSASAPEAPAHVPADMIRDHEIYYLPGAAKDTFAFLRTIHEDREIFFNLNADPIICPNGAWYVSSYKLVSEVLQNPGIFSSREMVKYSALVGEDWPMIPVELDAPDHTRIRMVVMPMFAPVPMKRLSDRIIERTEELIAGFQARGNCDFVAEFSTILPVKIFLELLDLPFDRFPDFIKWGDGIINSFIPEERTEATRAARSYLRDVIAERRANPGEDIISRIVQSTATDGKPLTEDELIGLTFMLFIGGLDTVAATLGFAFRYLAEHPEDRRKLSEQPDLIPTAVEEMLRAFSVVQAKRLVTRDIDFHGAPMKAGDYVTIISGLADTDPDEFGDGVQIDRANNRHVAFGMGPHRCLGSHLARLELRLVIETWLKHIPDFAVVPGARITSHGAGGVYGYDALPLCWSTEVAG
jgi:cytochrome P450